MLNCGAFIAALLHKSLGLCGSKSNSVSVTAYILRSVLVYDLAEYSTSMSLSATASSSETQLDGSVAAGKKMAGVIGYEAPEDWSTLEVTFKPNVWSGKNITFVAEKG